MGAKRNGAVLDLQRKEAEVQAARKADQEARVRACHAEVGEVMRKHRCNFLPVPSYRLSEDGSCWVTVVELRFKAIP